MLSAVVAVVLGSWIEGSVRHHLLDVRMELIAEVVDGLAADGLLPLDPAGTGSPAALDAAIEHRLIGGEIVGVAIHDPTGAILYGALTDVHATAAAAPTVGEVPHVEQHDDGLLHLVLPIDIPDRGLVGTFELLYGLEGCRARLGDDPSPSPRRATTVRSRSTSSMTDAARTAREVWG